MRLKISHDKRNKRPILENQNEGPILENQNLNNRLNIF